MTMTKSGKAKPAKKSVKKADPRHAAPVFKTRYIRDPKNHERVLTLVTKVTSKTVSFATALNTPPGPAIALPALIEERIGFLLYDLDPVLQEQIADRFAAKSGDRFTRKIGSKIAMGRLKSGRKNHVMSVSFDPKTQHPLIAALTCLSQERNSAGRIATAELRRLMNSPEFLPKA